jgi:HEAT repeat protein
VSAGETARVQLESLYYPKMGPAVMSATELFHWEDVKRQRVRALGLVQPLLDALVGTAPRARAYAAHWLGFLREPLAFGPLLDALRTTEPAVRRAAAKSLGRFRDPRAVSPLLELLNDPETEVAYAAASTLGSLEAAEAVAPLLEWCRSRDWRRREVALHALADINDPRRRDAAERALFDPKPQVRKVAKYILSRIYWSRVR